MNKKYELCFGAVSGVASIAFAAALINFSMILNSWTSVVFIIVWILVGVLVGSLYKRFKNNGKKIESNTVLTAFIFINLVLIYFIFKMIFLTN